MACVCTKRQWLIALLLALQLAGDLAAGEGKQVARQALAFDGQRDYVSAKLSALLDADVTLEAWVCMGGEARVQERVVALTGPEGALQICLNGGRVVVDNEGGPADGIASGRGQDDGRWHHVVVKRYEKTTYALHVDGVSVGSCSGTTPSYDGLYLGTAPGKPHFRGYIDEVRVYNRCLTDAEVHGNYTGEEPPVTDGLIGWWKLEGDVSDAVGGQDGQIGGAPKWMPGRGEALFDAPRVSGTFYPALRQVGVDIDSRLMGDLPAGASWEVVLREKDNDVVKHSVSFPVPSACVGAVVVPARGLPLGAYQVGVRIVDSQGTPFARTAFADVPISRQPAWASKLKVLNNLVWELLDVRIPAATADSTYTFTNPRRGWVFFSVAALADLEGDDRLEAILDSLPQSGSLTLHVAGGEPVQEAMRFLRSGEHTIGLTPIGRSSPARLVVRAIPHVVFDEYSQNHNVIKGFVPRDHAFMKRAGLLATSTTFRISGYTTPSPLQRGLEELRRAGRHVFEKIPIGEDESADAASERWLSPLSQRGDQLDGVIIDEVMRYDSLRTAALGKVLADPRMEGKLFYPFVCSPMPSRGGDEGVRFLRLLIGAGGHPMWERYLQEPAKERAAWLTLHRQVRTEVREHWLKVRPDAMAHTIICFGNFMSSPPVTLDVHPDVDFRVWMDMQYSFVANDPMFFGLAGVNEWTSGYADDEYLWWAAKLHRHYAIEGRRDRLSPTYGLQFRLTHISNPDFGKGLEGWNVEAARKGSVAARTFAGYSYLQGRYPATSRGDTFLWLKRSAEAANRVSQTIDDLVPGRLYSLKVITGDYRDLIGGRSAKNEHGVDIRIENVESLPEKCFAQTYTNWIDNGKGAFSRERPFWSRFHYRVFRAGDKDARLVLSDWGSSRDPGGPVGQEIALNFVEVQSYLGE